LIFKRTELIEYFYTNINQFLNRKDDLETAIAGNEPDIILITEILPKAQYNTITTALLSINDYHSFFNFDPAMVPSISVLCGVGIYLCI